MLATSTFETAGAINEGRWLIQSHSIDTVSANEVQD